MGNSANRDIRAADTQDKRHEALELRRQGLGYREIAAKLECSLGNAHKLVKTAIRQIPFESAKQVRKLELERLDRMQAGVGPLADSGDPRAILSVIKIMERRAKYLGLDAPQQLEHGGKDGAPIAVQLMPVIMIPPERTDDSGSNDAATDEASASGGLAPASGPAD